MKKLLIIALLFVGCEYNFFQDEGICVLKYMETNSYNCYPDTTESHCIADAENNDSIIIRYWGQNYDCTEYCSVVIQNETCEVKWMKNAGLMPEPVGKYQILANSQTRDIYSFDMFQEKYTSVNLQRILLLG